MLFIKNDNTIEYTDGDDFVPTENVVVLTEDPIDFAIRTLSSYDGWPQTPETLKFPSGKEMYFNDNNGRLQVYVNNEIYKVVNKIVKTADGILTMTVDIETVTEIYIEKTKGNEQILSEFVIRINEERSGIDIMEEYFANIRAEYETILKEPAYKDFSPAVLAEVAVGLVSPVFDEEPHFVIPVGTRFVAKDRSIFYNGVLVSDSYLYCGFESFKAVI